MRTRQTWKKFKRQEDGKTKVKMWRSKGKEREKENTPKKRENVKYVKFINKLFKLKEITNSAVVLIRYLFQVNMSNLKPEDDDPQQPQDQCTIPIHHIFWTN